VTLTIKDTLLNYIQHNDTQHKGKGFLVTLSTTTLNITALCMECHYAEWHISFIVMLNAIMLNVVILSAIMLNVIMLSAIMLNVVIPSVVAPSSGLYFKTFFTSAL
jgi:hypothetical protein